MKKDKQTNEKLNLRQEDTAQSTLLKKFQNSKECKELEIELKRLQNSERQLIENEKKYRSLTDNLNVGVYRNTPGAKGKFIEVNPALLKIFGYKSKKSILDMNVSDLYEKNSDRKKISDALKKYGFLKNATVNLVKKDGASIVCSISATSVNDANGKVIHYDGIVVDITNQLTAESALKASEEKYHKLFENSRDAVMTLNPPSWKFTSGNKAILEMFNIKDVKKFTSLGPWDLSPSKQPDGKLSAEKAKEMIEIAVEKGSNYFHWTHKQYNGKSFPATVLLTKIELKDEVFLQATVRDVSEQKRSEEINRSLFEISNAINTTQNLDDLYKSIYRSLERVLDVTNFFIALVDVKKQTLKFPFFVDTTDDDFEPITNFNTNDSLTGMVVSKRKPILLKKKVLDTRATKNGIWGPIPVIWMGVPLVIKDDIIGVIAVQSYSDPNLYNEQDLKMLSAVSDQVAIAIDRKRSEEALKKSEKKYRDLVEKSDDAMLIIHNNKFVDCNQATVDMLRYNNKKKFLNTHPSELSPEMQPDGQLSSDSANAMIKTALKNGSHRFEWNHRRADGEVFPVEVLLTAISTDKDNQILHTVWRDITERNEMQKALQESEEKLRTTVENIKDIIIWKMDGKGVFTYISSSVSDVLGYLPKEIEGTVGVSYFKKEDLPLLKEKTAERIAGNTFPHELEMIAKDGSCVPMEMISSAIKDENDSVIGFSGIARDITQRKETEVFIEKNTSQRSKLLEIARELGSSLDMEYILNIITNRMLELLESKGSTIYLLDNNKRYLKPIATNDEPYEEKVMSYDVAVNSSLSGKVVKSKRGMIFNNASQHPKSHQIPGTSEDIDENLMILPLLNEQEVFGTLNLYRIKKMFTQEEVEFAETFALHASTAIQNAVTNQELIREISERKLAEQTVRDSEEHYRGLSEASFEAIFISENGICLEQNLTAEKLFGYTLKEAIGKKITEWITPNDRKIIIEKIKNNIIEPYEVIALRKDGTTFHAEIQARIRKYRGKRVRVTALRDITDRVTARTELIKSEERFKRLFNDLGDAVFVTKLGGASRGKILEVNHAAEKQTGYSRNELLKMNIVKDLYISGTSETKEADWEQRLIHGEVVSTSEKKKRKDGTEYWTDVTVTAIEFNNEIVTLSINHDITERKLADKKLKSRNNELEIFNEVTVGRELKMIELKKEINKMLERSGKEPKYDIIT